MKKVQTCTVDRNGRIRKPDGTFGTLADVKRVNGCRIRRQLARWPGVRVIPSRA
ncbi:MAG: hypothetical protein OXU74_06565 [Gemmatimonadota bacterium]|nr:hypothetical protein [Gemmatimonadota bacterium]